MNTRVIDEAEYYRREYENEIRRKHLEGHGDIFTEEDIIAWKKRKQEIDNEILQE